MKLILFDVDGTLVDSAPFIHAIMCKTFEEAGKQAPDLDHTRAQIGLSLETAIAVLLNKEQIDDECHHLTQKYREHYLAGRSAPDFVEPLFDGIQHVLDTFKVRDDYILGAVTGKTRRGLDIVCRHHGFEGLFFVSRTADDCPSKPHPAMVQECCATTGIDAKDTYVIGDALFDIQMAKAAGAGAIGVSWGYGKVEELKAAGADAIAEHALEIPALIERIADDA